MSDQVSDHGWEGAARSSMPGLQSVAGPGSPGLRLRARSRNEPWAAQRHSQPSLSPSTCPGGRQRSGTGPGPCMPGQLYPHPAPVTVVPPKAAKGPAPSPRWLWQEDKVAEPAAASGQEHRRKLAQGCGDLPARQARLQSGRGWGRALLPPRGSQRARTPTRTQHPEVPSGHTVSPAVTMSSKPGGPEGGQGYTPTGQRGPAPSGAEPRGPSPILPQPLSTSHSPSDPQPLTVRSPRHRGGRKGWASGTSEGPSPVHVRSSDEGSCLTC